MAEGVPEPGVPPKPCRRDWVAVDGPAGAGKSTLARGLARALDWRYIDSGALYRAAALAVIEAGLDWQDLGNATAVAARVGSARITVGTDPAYEGPTPVWLDGRDVSHRIRLPDVTQAASGVARLGRVRVDLTERLRRLAEKGPCVMDGRDIGTVVLPDACVKLYVTASPEARAARRARELTQMAASEAGLEQVASGLRERDRQDATRDVAPLQAAPEALVVDTTELDVTAMIELALAHFRRRVGGSTLRSTDSPED